MWTVSHWAQTHREDLSCVQRPQEKPHTSLTFVHMEFLCVILFLVLGTSTAAPQDLRPKMLTFPEDSEANFVRVDLDRKELRAFTVCMRVFTDLVTRHSLFQLTTNSSYKPENNFLIYHDHECYPVTYKKSTVVFNRKDYKINVWQSVCASWASAHGLVRMWVDGTPSSRKFLSQSIMEGPMAVIIGKGSDIYWPHTFVGMISDLHLWDYELNSYQIQQFGPFSHYPHSTVLKWASLDLQIQGRVLVEDKS